jgi:hypothetical protein
MRLVMRLKVLIFFAVGLLFTAFVSAQTIKSAHVFGEAGTDDNKTCQFGYASSIAAVESTLRYNKLSVDKKPNGIVFYLNVVNTEINSYNCSVGLKLEVKYYDIVRIPGSGKKISASILLCSEGGAGMMSKINMQSKVNETLQDYANQCISEIEKLAVL